jgi:hypothetical protein
MRDRAFAAALLGLFTAASWVTPALAQDEYRHGRIRHVEGGTTLQRASETAAEEAFRNLPFFPGDRVWTDDSGRAEFQFAAGSMLRLDSRSKLDYIAHDDRQNDDRVVLRLWSGALFLHTREQSPAFDIETPAGLVQARDRSVVRVDIDRGDVQVSVFEGEAAVDTGTRSLTRLSAGERTFVRPGEAPESPRGFDLREADDFARWASAREERAWASDGARYLPEEVAPYAPELDENGSWYYEAELGYVWRPRVAAGWRPYVHGRWAWSPYGWTWVPNEPWGWAPFHYGRWGHSAAVGWYWIPGRTWGPAWVSWSVGNDYVGWCPLGYRDRPVVFQRGRVRGHAVPRGSAEGRDAWVYARRADLGARDLQRRHVELDEERAAALRVVDRQRAHVDRSGSAAEGRAAVPRNVATRPVPGDTIEELRTDPATTIPFPVARRRYPSEDERRERERTTDQMRRWRENTSGAAAAPAAGEQEPEAASRTGRARDGEWRFPSSRGANRIDHGDRDTQRAREAEAARQRDAQRSNENAGRDRADREVLRRLFGGIRSRERDAGESRPDASAGEPAARSQSRPRDQEPAYRQPQRREQDESGRSGAGGSFGGVRSREREPRSDDGAGARLRQPRSQPRESGGPPPRAERPQSRPDDGERGGAARRREKER